MTRREVASYTDEVTEDKKAICHECYNEHEITVKLSPYYTNGILEPYHKKCGNCGLIIDTRRAKHVSEIGVLGSNQYGPGEASFEVVSKKRKTRVKKGEDVFDVSDYKLPNGKIDTDLQHYANSGIITSITDEEQ